MTNIHIFNRNLNDKFFDSRYENSVQVFLNGLIDAAKSSCNVMLYTVSMKARDNQNKIEKIKGKNSFFLFRALANRNKSSGKDIFILLGYNPIEIIQLLILQFFGFNCYTYLFDSHEVSIQSIDSRVRRYVANIYFKLGFELCRFVTGVVTINPLFFSKYPNKFRRVIRSKPAYKNREFDAIDSYSSVISSPKGRLSVVFGGSLNYDNGAHLVSDVVRMSFPFDIDFHIYGSGPIAERFYVDGSYNSRVFFHGNVDNEEVLRIIRDCDLSLNLRDPESKNKFVAFPSKLLEYLFNNDKVISNTFPGLFGDLSSALVRECSFDTKSIYDCLSEFGCQNSGEGVTPIESSLAEIRQSYSWNVVFSQLLNDLSNV